MMDGQNQAKGMNQRKERTITLKLSDTDVERLALKAASGGIHVEELLENFIGDLVRSPYSNGSDERLYAEQWFDRCWFGSYAPTSSLLQHLARDRSIKHAFDLKEKLRYSMEDAKEETLIEEERSEIRQVIYETAREIAELFGKYHRPEDWQKVVEWKDRLNRMLEEAEKE